MLCDLTDIRNTLHYSVYFTVFPLISIDQGAMIRCVCHCMLNFSPGVTAALYDMKAGGSHEDPYFSRFIHDPNESCTVLYVQYIQVNSNRILAE